MRRSLTLSLWLALACKEKVVFPEDDDSWQEAMTCPPSTNPRILVTNSGDDSISWIDMNGPLAEWTVCTEPVGLLPPEREGPHHGASFADGSAYFIGLSNYVPGSGSGPHGSHGTGDVRGYLLKYDGQTHDLIGRRLVDRSPGDVRLTPDERYVLQSHFDLLRITEYLMPQGDASAASPNSKLAVVDAQTMQDVAMVDLCPAAHGIGIGETSTAYVSCYGSDEIAVVTLSEPWDVELFRVGTLMVPLGSEPAYGPYAVAVEPGTGYLWVSNTQSQDVRVFNGTELVGSPISTQPGAPFFGDFTETHFVAPLQGTNSLGFIDRSTYALEVSPELGRCIAPHAVMHIEGDLILVACEGNHQDPGTVVVVNRTTRVVDQVFDVGVYPDDLVLVP